ncbi:MAG: segregation and condensation protein A, partial [Rhodothermales bacterium]
MMYRVRVQEFEGPLDLLLFFIRRDELDIFDIPIAYITEEYLSFVRVLEQIDLDSVGEFLYMAAMLINIKARMLLPRPDLDDEGEPIDPRRELVERLLEYVRFKEASQQFATLKERRDELFTRGLAGRPADADGSSAEVTIE